MLLEGLSGDVQREVIAVHHTLDEVEVLRQQLLEVVADEHLAHVEPQSGVIGVVVVVHARRRGSGNVQDGAELDLALGFEVRPSQRLVVVVADALVEVLVLLIGDVVRRASPDGLVGVDPLPLEGRDGLRLRRRRILLLVVLRVFVGLFVGLLVVVLVLVVEQLLVLVVIFHVHGDGLLLLEVDGEGDELRVALDELLQALLARELEGVFLEEEGDFRAASQRAAFRVGDHVEVAVRRGLPDVLVVVIVLGAHTHAVGHQVDGVESHAELPDEADVSLSAERLGEVRGA
mmetsp:Transcript_12088/g.44852  ORF Transcript_12088/g.44852 Transcript_12088/m.44852 type:complete len:289 (-) Transcript_12088:492-1358(-)